MSSQEKKGLRYVYMGLMLRGGGRGDLRALGGGLLAGGCVECWRRRGTITHLNEGGIGGTCLSLHNNRIC